MGNANLYAFSNNAIKFKNRWISVGSSLLPLPHKIKLRFWYLATFGYAFPYRGMDMDIRKMNVKSANLMAAPLPSQHTNLAPD